MTIVTGYVRDQNGDYVSGVTVRLYRRDTGALLGQTTTEIEQPEQPGAGEPHYDQVACLLHFDGANNSATFTDSGPDNLTITKTGSPIISTAQSVFGGSSGKFGSIGTIAIPVSAAKNIRGQPFTIEFRYRPVSNTGLNGIISGRNAGINCPIEIQQDYSHLKLFVSNAALSSWVSSGRAASDVFSSTAWTDICLTGDGNNLYLFCNGVLKTTLAQPAWTAAAGTWYVGRGGDGTNDCYIDELRITVGVARYTSGYTIATEAFQDAAVIPAQYLGRYQIDTTYSGEVQRVVLDPDGDPLQNDLLDRIILP